MNLILHKRVIMPDVTSVECKKKRMKKLVAVLTY